MHDITSHKVRRKQLNTKFGSVTIGWRGTRRTVTSGQSGIWSFLDQTFCVHSLHPLPCLELGKNLGMKNSEEKH